jgi:acyl-CoA synthetase (AMP-forming)/AMP-acid ligase II
LFATIPSVRCESQNVAHRLTLTAAHMPDGIAIAVPGKRGSSMRRPYRTLTFRELDDSTNRIAAGLRAMGIVPGIRLVLLVRPGIEFISLTFAILKAGAIVVLIDPGIGRKHMIGCLTEVRPEGFLAIPQVQALRVLMRRRFPDARFNVTVGRRWFWGGPTLRELSDRNIEFTPQSTPPDQPAAIIFTSGSTGPPKGVLYRHGNFLSQIDQLQSHYRIEPGEVDLPGFPLFALFNAAMGVTTVVPDMDATRPAKVNSVNIVEAIRDWNVTQAFGSPAMWNTVSRYCEANRVTFSTLRRVLSAGAPVPPHVIARLKKALPPECEIHTPYGCTEALPVASISGIDVLAETAAQTARGQGTCVGRSFSGIEWKVIRITDEPISRIDDTEELPTGDIGELIVRGPVVTSEYVTRVDQNPFAKIGGGINPWHRMGDVGYLDDQQRFWFCGRKSHRVITEQETLFTIPCEAIFNNHQSIYRSALVGVGRPGEQVPAIVAEPWPEKRPANISAERKLIDELFSLGQSHELTQSIRHEHIFVRNELPVDIRHNAKIFREELAHWVRSKIR